MLSSWALPFPLHPSDPLDRTRNVLPRPSLHLVPWPTRHEAHSFYSSLSLYTLLTHLKGTLTFTPLFSSPAPLWAGRADLVQGLFRQLDLSSACVCTSRSQSTACSPPRRLAAPCSIDIRFIERHSPHSVSSSSLRDCIQEAAVQATSKDMCPETICHGIEQSQSHCNST